MTCALHGTRWTTSRPREDVTVVKREPVAVGSFAPPSLGSPAETRTTSRRRGGRRTACRPHVARRHKAPGRYASCRSARRARGGLRQGQSTWLRSYAGCWYLIACSALRFPLWDETLDSIVGGNGSRRSRMGGKRVSAEAESGVGNWLTKRGRLGEREGEGMLGRWAMARATRPRKEAGFTLMHFKAFQSRSRPPPRDISRPRIMPAPTAMPMDRSGCSLT